MTRDNPVYLALMAVVLLGVLGWVCVLAWREARAVEAALDAEDRRLADRQARIAARADRLAITADAITDAAIASLYTGERFGYTLCEGCVQKVHHSDRGPHALRCEALRLLVRIELEQLAARAAAG